MTNRAQAKPTKDPKDLIQQQSLLQVTFISALIVFGTICWLFLDDFWIKKPWKQYQSNYQEVVAKFLAEELEEARASAQVNMDRIGPALEQARGRIEAASAELDRKAARETEISSEIAALDAALTSLQGDLTDDWWQKEMASIIAAEKYKVEHGKGYTVERYLTVLDEVRRRVSLISTFRADRTFITNQLPELDRDLSELEAFLFALTGDLDKMVQTLGAISEYERDWQQVFVDNGGSNDIIDRCESCHRGADESYLDRDKMWGSHLSNEIVSEFLEEYKDYDAGWTYSPMRQRVQKHVEMALGSVGSPVVNVKSSEEVFDADGMLLDDAYKMISLRTADALEVELRKAAEGDMKFIEAQYSYSWRFMGNKMIDPELMEDLAYEGEDAQPIDHMDVRNRTSQAVADVSKKYELYDPDYAQKPLPQLFLASEVMIYLSSEGPWPMSGVSAYPDRFKLMQFEWFQNMVQDERAIELYRMLYRKLRHHIQEDLLLFTTHPRRTEIMGDVHDKKEFGCSSCHRGFGVNAKTIDSAHGNMHHWLTPLFRDGYQEAGCQKCHKAEIELEGSKRIQRGKDLYQELGCWGCHAYEGYESEIGEKLVVAKTQKDVLGQIDDAITEYEAKRAELDWFNTPAADELAGSNESRFAAEFANAQKAEQAAQRQVLDLQEQARRLEVRLDELEIEHKRRGPSLLDISEKVSDENKGWLANWIAYPKSFRPSTKMPHFWYGPFAFVDQEEVAAAGGDVSEAFAPGHAGNPLYRRLNKQTVDAMKGVIQHIYQSSLVAADLNKINRVSNHSLESADAAKGEGLFQDKGCMSCHGASPDLVKGSVSIPIETYDEETGEVSYISYESSTEWMPAPRYRYRLDDKIQRDGHGNAVSNEFIYSFAANLSRIGEKADPSYMVEWVLQPRLRNKRAIMPSFWPAIAGTPEGLERDNLNKLIVDLNAATQGKQVEALLAARVHLADAKRMRGDIDQASRDLYASVRDAINAKGETLPDGWGVIRRNLDLALKGYGEALDMVKYLTGLRNPELLGEDGNYNAYDPVNGYIDNYSYAGKVLNFDEEANAMEEGNPAGLPLHSKPEGALKDTRIDVTGFGNFEFMNEGYDEYLASRRAQVTTANLAKLASSLVKAADAAHAALAKLTIEVTDDEGNPVTNARWVQDALAAYSDFANANNAFASALEDAQGNGLAGDFETMYGSETLNRILNGTPQNRDELMLQAKLQGFTIEGDDAGEEGEEAALQASRMSFDQKLQAAGSKFGQMSASFIGDAARTAVLNAIRAGNADEVTMNALAMSAARAAADSVDMQIARRLAFNFEAITPAGTGRAFTTYYGCAGCHEIEGMENEGKIGVELTYEGSKFIQRLDFGLLEHHSVAGDDKTPSSASWLLRGSLRPYNFASQPVTTVAVSNPENLPVVRGGVGFELPEGIRSRYIHSKFDYHSRASWFQGKLHHPRQWDKGRQLQDKEAWFERTRMPLFELNEDDLYSITLFVEGSENMVPWGAGGEAFPDRYIYNHDGVHNTRVEGWHVLRKYNCIACHSIGEWEGRYRRLAERTFGTLALDAHNADGLELNPFKPTDDMKNVPPRIEDAGARLNSEWLVTWLQNPYEVRGMAQADSGATVVMPQFYLTKSEAEKVQGFLTERADVPQVSSTRAAKSDPRAIAFGREIFKKAAGQCQSCHSISDETDGYLAPSTAPNLHGIAKRVRKDWVRKWLQNPDAIQPLGRMPIFFEFDVTTDRWILKDESNQGQKLQAAKALNYEGDHIEALIAWLYEEMPNLNESELAELYESPLAEALPK